MNAAIADVITAIEKASRGAEVRQKMADALTELNKNALPAVTAADAGKALVVGPDGNWTVGEVGGDTAKALIEGTLTDYESTATTICDYAFNGYRNLKSVSFPEAAAIGDHAFGLSMVESVSAPNATRLGSACFLTSRLREATFPKAVSVGVQAFAYCNYLTAVSLPLAEIIGHDAFDECSMLRAVHLPEARQIHNSAFSWCDNLESITLPKAEEIMHHAFERCTALRTATLPSLVSLGYEAFLYCNSLTDIYLPNSLMATVDRSVGYGFSSLTVHVPTDLVAAYQSDSVWGRYNIVAL